jgi:hypothetical protein
MICGDCFCHPDVRRRVSLQACPAEEAGGQLQDVALPGCVVSEVVVLNIQSYSGGMVKTPTAFPRPSSPGDGLLEVVGLGGYVKTSTLVALCMCCVSPMRRIAQSPSVRLQVNDAGGPVIAQFDGEPFFLPAGAVVELTKEPHPVVVLSLKKQKK